MSKLIQLTTGNCRQTKTQTKKKRQTSVRISWNETWRTSQTKKRFIWIPKAILIPIVGQDFFGTSGPPKSGEMFVGHDK